MTDSPDCSQRRAARSRIWAAGSFGEAAKSNPSRVASVSKRARRIRRCRDMDCAAGDLVLAQDLEEVQVAEFPGVGLGEAGVQGGEHAGQLQVAQRGREGAAVGDGDGGHEGSCILDRGADAHRVPGECAARRWIQPRVLPGRGAGAGAHPVRAASRATAAGAGRRPPAGAGTWMTISSCSGGRRPGPRCRPARSGPQRRGSARERGRPAAGRSAGSRRRGHDVILRPWSPGVTASLGTVPGMGMTFANDAGPRRNAAAPPSPAAAGSWSRSAPAARMPRTVR